MCKVKINLNKYTLLFIRKKDAKNGCYYKRNSSRFY